MYFHNTLKQDLALETSISTPYFSGCNSKPYKRFNNSYQPHFFFYYFCKFYITDIHINTCCLTKFQSFWAVLKYLTNKTFKHVPRTCIFNIINVTFMGHIYKCSSLLLVITYVKDSYLPTPLV